MFASSPDVKTTRFFLNFRIPFFRNGRGPRILARWDHLGSDETRRPLCRGDRRPALSDSRRIKPPSAGRLPSAGPTGPTTSDGAGTTHSDAWRASPRSPKPQDDTSGPRAASPVAFPGHECHLLSPTSRAKAQRPLGPAGGWNAWVQPPPPRSAHWCVKQPPSCTALGRTGDSAAPRPLCPRARRRHTRGAPGQGQGGRGGPAPPLGVPL